LRSTCAGTQRSRQQMSCLPATSRIWTTGRIYSAPETDAGLFRGLNYFKTKNPMCYLNRYIIKPPKLSDDRSFITGLPYDWREISSSSPATDRKACETLATCFKREMHYGFVQYIASSHGHEKDRVLVLESPSYVEKVYAMGAVCIRWREYTDHEPEYAMAWVWLHPYMRRQRHLTRLIPYLKATFSPLLFETPISSAMQSFIKNKWEAAE